jgi:hypothetical protein
MDGQVPQSHSNIIDNLIKPCPYNKLKGFSIAGAADFVSFPQNFARPFVKQGAGSVQVFATDLSVSSACPGDSR